MTVLVFIIVGLSGAYWAQRQGHFRVRAFDVRHHFANVRAWRRAMRIGIVVTPLLCGFQLVLSMAIVWMASDDARVAVTSLTAAGKVTVWSIIMGVFACCASVLWVRLVAFSFTVKYWRQAARIIHRRKGF